MKRKSTWRQDFARNKYKYLIFLPVTMYLLLFCYKPMYGAIIAFQKYRPALGILKSQWVGFENFENFFGDFYFARILRNTLLLSCYQLAWGFPLPILFALLLNELKSPRFKRFVQTTSYLPHFISLVVVCSLIKQFSLTKGLFNEIIAFFGGERTPLLQYPNNFRTIYVASEVWQHFGWNSIIYLAALTSIDPALYEAAEIDGAGRLRRALHITIPGLTSTITMMLILNVGGILSLGSEKVLLLYNQATYKTADIISTYTYRKGLIESDFSFSTAVGLFNSAVNVCFLISANLLSKKVTNVGLF